MRVWKEARKASDALRLGREDVPTKPEKKKKVKNNGVRSRNTTTIVDQMLATHQWELQSTTELPRAPLGPSTKMTGTPWPAKSTNPRG